MKRLSPHVGRQAWGARKFKPRPKRVKKWMSQQLPRLYLDMDIINTYLSYSRISNEVSARHVARGMASWLTTDKCIFTHKYNCGCGVQSRNSGCLYRTAIWLLHILPLNLAFSFFPTYVEKAIINDWVYAGCVGSIYRSTSSYIYHHTGKWLLKSFTIYHRLNSKTFWKIMSCNFRWSFFLTWLYLINDSYRLWVVWAIIFLPVSCKTFSPGYT